VFLIICGAGGRHCRTEAATTGGFEQERKSLAGRRYPDREIRALLETLSEPSAADQPPATSP
jgi:hypothetical protein